MLTSANRGVFAGEISVIDFLNPAKHPPLPLVEIPNSLNPFRSDGVRIFAKLLSMSPLTNVKSIPAHNMLALARERGELEGVGHIVESSSGNTVLSLGLVGKAFGIPRTSAYVSRDVTPEKLDLLRFLDIGVRVFDDPICPDPNDPQGSILHAQQDGSKPGWYNPGQYRNTDNPLAHTQLTGPQIWMQTQGKLTVFCAGLGTTGTLCGTSEYLRSVQPGITTVGVVRAPNNPVPGVRTKNLLEEIDFDWQSAANETVSVGTVDAYEKSLELSRSGILAWPSSGFGLQGLLQFLEERKAGGFSGMRNEDGEVVCAFIVCDLPFVYLKEYFEFLPEDRFSPIENRELLTSASHSHEHSPRNSSGEDLILPTSHAPEFVYGLGVDTLRKLSKEGNEIEADPKISLLDISSPEAYAKYHLPGAVSSDFERIVENLEVFKKELNGKIAVIVCERGARSHALSHLLEVHGIPALSLEGGMLEWSKLDMPRVTDASCPYNGNA